MSLGSEQAFKESDNYGVFFIDGLKGSFLVKVGGESGPAGNGGSDIGLARGEAEAGVCLFSATGTFIEDGAVNFGDDNVVAAAEIGGV